MANAFSKQEKVAFDDVLAGFDDALVLSRLVKRGTLTDQEAARSNDTFWRPVPYIVQSFDGMDQTGNFLDKTQLSVPANIGFKKAVPLTMDARELADALQEKRLGEAAKQRLGSDINLSVMQVAANLGSIVSKRPVGARGFDDLADADARMNELGVPQMNRSALYSSRVYNRMASDLAARQTMAGKPTTAYESAQVGRSVAGFDVFKMDYALRLNAATATGVVINGASQFYTPAATATGTTGINNVDNRFQTIAITVGGSTVKVGDAFTIAGVNATHHITKADTGQLKTFRVVAIVTGAGGTGTIQITPPIVSGQGASQAEIQYKNVTATPASGAAIVFLNTVTADANPFFHRDAIEVLPARYTVPAAGVEVMSATTDQGFTVVCTKQFDNVTMKYRFRYDCVWGVTYLNTEMGGIQLVDQT